MNISITGTLGSGKSSVCKILKENGYEVISNGTLFRQIAEERGVSVVELNKLAETDPTIDKMLDDRSIQMGKEKDMTIFDSRMGWHFIPDSFKVFLLADVDEAARRVFCDNRVSEEYETQEQAKETLLRRQLLEKSRFSGLYQVDYLDLSHYNLVIESSSVTPEEVAEKILEYVKEGDLTKKRFLLNPTSLYATQNLENAEKETGELKICLSGNHFCVAEGHQMWLDALKNKKKFVEPEYQEKKIELLKDDELKEFEAEGEFAYRSALTEGQDAYLSYTK